MFWHFGVHGDSLAILARGSYPILVQNVRACCKGTSHQNRSPTCTAQVYYFPGGVSGGFDGGGDAGSAWGSGLGWGFVGGGAGGAVLMDRVQPKLSTANRLFILSFSIRVGLPAIDKLRTQ